MGRFVKDTQSINCYLTNTTKEEIISKVDTFGSNWTKYFSHLRLALLNEN
jgi:hypothetical protein